MQTRSALLQDILGKFEYLPRYKIFWMMFVHDVFFSFLGSDSIRLFVD